MLCVSCDRPPWNRINVYKSNSEWFASIITFCVYFRRRENTYTACAKRTKIGHMDCYQQKCILISHNIFVFDRSMFVIFVIVLCIWWYSRWALIYTHQLHATPVYKVNKQTKKTNMRMDECRDVRGTHVHISNDELHIKIHERLSACIGYNCWLFSF